MFPAIAMFLVYIMLQNYDSNQSPRTSKMMQYIYQMNPLKKETNLFSV